jgi:DNA-binding FadR family transcriptional regulator
LEDVATEPAERVPGQRLAESVASWLEREIIAEGWPVGEVLGSETDLIARAGVSRAVFREAARILEHKNVVRMRRGPHGGLVVLAPEAGPVADVAALYLRFAGVAPKDLFETRTGLEVACAGRAAERITEEGIARMRATLTEEEAAGTAAWSSGRCHHLHTVIADITGNKVDELFIQVLTQLTQDATAAGLEDMDPDEGFRQFHRAHTAIVEAIAGGDVALAQHRMRRHLQGLEEFFLIGAGAER